MAVKTLFPFDIESHLKASFLMLARKRHSIIISKQHIKQGLYNFFLSKITTSMYITHLSSFK